MQFCQMLRSVGPIQSLLQMLFDPSRSYAQVLTVSGELRSTTVVWRWNENYVHSADAATCWLPDLAESEPPQTIKCTKDREYTVKQLSWTRYAEGVAEKDLPCWKAEVMPI
jgi:hypothetical protein